MKPIFLLSMPRSGSTLLQRVLASHPEIATRSEPWILLPLLYMLESEGVFTDYGHRFSHRAINEFLGSIKDGDEKFKQCVNHFANDLYGSACQDGERFFLDKTPRYSLIAKQVFDIFPDDKFLILWRNPLALVASILKTFRRSRFMFLGNNIDLYDGFTSLYDAYKANTDKVCAIKFEDFVLDTDNQLKKIFDHLGITYDPSIISEFDNVELKGTYGDKVGLSEFTEINSGPLDSWKNILNTPVRKMWCRRYLKWLGEERLKAIGYSYNELIDDLNSVPNQYLKSVADVFSLLFDLFCRLVEPYILRRKFKEIMSPEIRTRFLS